MKTRPYNPPTFDTSPPAFPRPYFEHPTNGEYSTPQAGMSLRDYFAGQALAGIFASYASAENLPAIEFASRVAYLHADAMIEERAKGPAFAGVPAPYEGG